jgi:RNA polymerase sigma factor (sigma-70 family)
MDPDMLELSALIAGVPSAFDLAFAQFHQRVYGFALRMTRQRDVAQDVVQETFLRLAQRASKLDPDTNLRAWLFTVAHRLVIDHVRKMQVRAAMTADLWTRAHAETPFAGQQEMIAHTQTERVIEQAIAQLPVKYRDILLLVAFEELSVQDAAAVVGIAPDAARQRLSRARQMIAAALDGAESLSKERTRVIK